MWDHSSSNNCLSFCFLGDSSEYHVNGKHVTLAKYLEELEKIGIVTKTHNCLVFQVNIVIKMYADTHEIMLQCGLCGDKDKVSLLNVYKNTKNTLDKGT